MISEFVIIKDYWMGSFQWRNIRKQLDVSRLSKLGWEAKTTLEFGLKKTIARNW